MIIEGQHVWVDDRFLPAQIEVENGKIREVLTEGEKTADLSFGEERIVPGFLDVHCHGAFGFDTNTADPAGLTRWAKEIVKEGVTGFLATTLTEDKEILIKALANVAAVKEALQPGKDGAEILGVHFEGPYLDKAYKGAQPEEAIAAPSVQEFQEYYDASKGLIRIMTLAIEHDRDYELTQYATKLGVAVSVGHSGATFEQTKEAVHKGLKSVTHTFNRQTPLSHREPGVVGAALYLDDLYAEIIGDGQHVTPEVVNLFFRCKGENRGVLVSDALMCKGYPAGTRFQFGPQEIEIYPDGSAHLTSDGNFAGSTMKMNEGLHNLVEKAQVPFVSALNACTCNPAALLGMDDKKGKIRAGFDADLCVLGDDYTVKAVYCAGVRQEI